MWAQDGAEMAEAFVGQLWQEVTDDDLAPTKPVPTMLSAAECQLYHWVGNSAKGLGATADLGAFAGGSAARRLSGLARSSQPYQLHAFDPPARSARHWVILPNLHSSGK
jgi:hypothetical protein